MFERPFHLDRVSFHHVMLAGIVSLVILLSGMHSYAAARSVKQKSFTSAEEAVKALVQAIKSDDNRAVEAILGPGSKDIVSSGDKVADKARCEKFIKAYEEMNKLEKETPEKAVLHVGPRDWPLPIPIVKRGNVWLFDTKTAKEEILNRRIGRNELGVVEVLHAYVDAQREYAGNDRNGDGVLEFSRRFNSTDDQHDGLYWVAKEGEEESPLGPLVAKAAMKGYREENAVGGPSPFRGYYYKILEGQGKHATGGAYSYVANGKMILGFALIAYPARYGNSGIMTFIVNQEGVAYEKDLGKKTGKIANGIKVFDPDKTWKKVEDAKQ